MDLILGAIDHYGYDQIKLWHNSILKSGFTGRVALVAFRITQEEMEKIKGHNIDVIVVGAPVKATVHLERFIHFWNYLQLREEVFENVIITDVRDVVFQSDPSEFFSGRDPMLVVGSENLKYKDEAWGDRNLFETFGLTVYNKFKDKEIYNVGAFGGQWQLVQSMCLMIYTMGVGRPIPICDQSVFNFLLYQAPFDTSPDIFFAEVHDCWAAHCGTLLDPTKIAGFKPNHINNVDGLMWNEEHGVLNNHYRWESTDPWQFDSLGTPVILHQYDRVPGLKEKVEAKYG
jgi:hypothetical protein